MNSPVWRVARYGSQLASYLRTVGHLETLPATPLGRVLGFTDDEIEGFAELFDLLRPLIASAYLTMNPTPEQVEDALAAQYAAGEMLTGPQRSELITWVHRKDAAEIHTQAATATLAFWGGWTWSEKQKRATRAPQKGGGNRPHELFTEAVTVLYDAWHPGEGPKNPKALRGRIAHALRWFFRSTDLDPSKSGRIYNAIQRNRPNLPRRR